IIDDNEIRKKKGKKLKDVKTIDLVHYELLVSQLLRNKEFPFSPARIVEPYDPISISFKDVCYYENNKLGLQYERFEKGLEFLLIHDQIKDKKSELNIPEKQDSDLEIL
ncbi:MAG: hypothetical protein ACOC3V_00960, partial [bacterium]